MHAIRTGSLANGETSASPNAAGRLLDRVVQAAEEALADHSCVSGIDVLVGMRLLAPAHVNAWRKARIDFLEDAIQGNLHRISSSMAMFREWVRAKGLKPSETRYVRHLRNGIVDLGFTNSGDPMIERNYRTRFVSPALSEVNGHASVLRAPCSRARSGNDSSRVPNSNFHPPEKRIWRLQITPDKSP